MFSICERSDFMKTLYEYNGSHYKFNNQKFSDLFMPDNLDMSRAKRKRDLLQKEDMATTEQTVEAWYKNISSPSDICIVQQIAHYLDVDTTELLIETDEVMEHIKEASTLSNKRTIEASIEHFKNWMISTSSDNPEFTASGIKRITGYLPKGLPIIIMINVCILWLIELDISTQITIAPFVLLISIELLRFCRFSYFKKKSRLIKIWSFIERIIEFFLLSNMLKKAYYNWIQIK